MPIVTNPVSTQPQGAVLTNTALSAISVATTTENTVVQTLGGSTVGDGLGGLYFFQAGSSRAIDNVTCLGTPTTGRWIGAHSSNSFSGVGPVTTSLTGYGETFVLLSGFAPLTYALPPSTSVIGKMITIKDMTTGTITVRAANGTDLIYDTSKTSPVLSSTSLTATLTGGFVFNLRATSGAFYRVDNPASVA
jgi:hypothetical protein